MSVFARFILAMVIALIVIVLSVILGDYGSWYFAWLLGTGFMILVAAMGGVLYEAQEDARKQGEDQPGKKAGSSGSSSGY